jgi:hypothetical protein
MPLQVSGERPVILEASPHPPEASLEYGRGSRLVLNLPYEFSKATAVNQSHENIIHARSRLIRQKQVGLELTLFEIRSEPIEALGARKANAVIPNGC